MEIDNMTVQNHLRSIGVGGLPIRPEIPPPEPLAATPGERAEAVDFKELLGGEIEKVNSQLVEADRAIGELAAGRSTDVHSTLIALQKANLSLRMLIEVRNKVMRAYEEIMRMQA
jgi:flagellar hook-basal body complex protein FliE